MRPDEVALLVDDAILLRELQERIVAAGCFPCDRALARQASVLVVEAPASEISDAVGDARALARSDAAILVLAAEASAASAARARAAGAFACLHAPFLADEIMALVDAALEVRSARRRVADLSHKLDLEAHLASVGRITAGVTHELASPLAAAMMNLDIAREELGATRATADARAAIDDAVGSLARARDLLQTMQELVRQAPPSLATIDLVAIAHEVHATAARTPSMAGVSFERVLDEPQLEVLSERARLTQIVWNLTSNAAQAAARLAVPRVRLHAYRVNTDAIISVRDNGPGISASELEKIFEPFYTTRRDEGGTGLGLALCREYAIQIGADLSVSSAPGRGACFRLRLPLQRPGGPTQGR